MWHYGARVGIIHCSCGSVINIMAIITVFLKIKEDTNTSHGDANEDLREDEDNLSSKSINDEDSDNDSNHLYPTN